MSSLDVVAMALAAPMDWGRFEELVYAILVADDLPRLRKVGGRKDKGIDSFEETFYRAEREISTIVQVTSQRAQLVKVTDTITVLRESGNDCKHLIMVFRQPVASSIRTQLIEQSRKSGISVDIREEQYLIGQLSKPKSPVFARFFSSPGEQLKQLLERPDPLQVADSRSRHALLASLGAYVLAPQASLARSVLFEKTVLAAVAADGARIGLDDLLEAVKGLLPGESIDNQRITVAINALQKLGQCEQCGNEVCATESAIASIGQAAEMAESAYKAIIDYVTNYCERYQRLDDATRGYIERNIRRALLSLLRAIGPLGQADTVPSIDSQLSNDLLQILSRDLPQELGRAALIALSSFVGEAENQALLGPFVRTYAALAIRNLDPIGRSWQKAILSRSIIALDTDAVLYLLIEELPEHRPLRIALQALVDEGVQIVVAKHVFTEVVDHISRAGTTFRRFSQTLLRMPATVVDGRVWHAVVRGYYYAVQQGFAQGPWPYWQKYFDRSQPENYVHYLLERRIRCQTVELDEIPKEWLADFEILSAAALKNRERHRWKAEFREPTEMQARVRADVRMALHLAAHSNQPSGLQARGYLASGDVAFSLIEKHPQWNGRERVLIITRAIPELAGFICASHVTDDELVRLLFDPVFAAAADQVGDTVMQLAAIGADLKTVPLDRLEWDLAKTLQARIHDWRQESDAQAEGEPSEKEIQATLNVLQGVAEAGYTLDPRVAEVAKRFDAVVGEVEEERKRREDAEAKLQQLAVAARGTTKRGRRRVNKILRELGIELDISEEPDDEDLVAATG